MHYNMSSKSINKITEKDRDLILEALQDAIEWQNSIADAHYYSINPWDRNKKMAEIAKEAKKAAMCYKELSDKIKEEL